jgi:hypothetical protein
VSDGRSAFIVVLKPGRMFEDGAKEEKIKAPLIEEPFVLVSIVEKSFCLLCS